MQSVNILIQALQQYEGTYVVVSHDRYFVTNIANKIWYIEDYEIKEYPGSFDEYEVWQASRGILDASAPKKSSEKPKPELAPHSPKITSTNPSQEKLIEKLESKIMDLEVSIADLENTMAELAQEGKFNELPPLELQIDEKKEELLKITNEWELLIN
jgi:ATP-binding cassette subfamily F protein 3